MPIIGAPKLPMPPIPGKGKSKSKPSESKPASKPVVIETKPTPGTHQLQVVEIDDPREILLPPPKDISQSGPLPGAEHMVEMIIHANEQLEETGLKQSIESGVEEAASAVASAVEGGLKDAAEIAGNVASDAVGFAGSLLSSFLGPVLSNNIGWVLLIAGVALLALILLLKFL